MIERLKIETEIPVIELIDKNRSISNGNREFCGTNRIAKLDK